MQTATELDVLRTAVAAFRDAGETLALVPTMGALHEGHLTLVRQAKARADRVAVSIFVNPTQFGPNEDFARYPRTPQADVDGLAAAGCAVAWMPTVETMYPHGVEASVRVVVPGVTEVLEGAHRPGHFDGVSTVVARLFNQVQPDVAVFGRKDYQQLAVIRYMVRDLAFPLEVVAGATQREDDGLAMSSRNQYLSPAERATAPILQQALQAMRAALDGGATRVQVEAEARARLDQAGFDVDYVVVRRPDLGMPEPGPARPGEPLVALVAARLGRTRLIDNLEFTPGEPGTAA